MKLVTMQSIAEDCGKSVTTVSNVLNMNGKFSSRTRDAVLSSAHRLGYVTDFSSYEEKVVALKVSDEMEGDVARRLVGELSSIASYEGLVLTFLNAEERCSSLLLCGHFAKRQREELSLSCQALCTVSEDGDVQMGERCTAEDVVSDIEGIGIDDPLVLYESEDVLSRFSPFGKYDRIYCGERDEKGILKILGEYGKRNYLLLCPERPEVYFRCLKLADMRSPAILVQYFNDEEMDDSGLGYIRYDVYSKEKLKGVLSALGRKEEVPECVRRRVETVFIGGIRLTSFL